MIRFHLARLVDARLICVRADRAKRVHKAGGNGKRKLFEILKAKEAKPTQEEQRAIHELADRNITSLSAALTQQNELNAALAPWDAFVLASDLEGLLLDTIGQTNLAALIGPDGSKDVDRVTAERFSQGTAGYEAMASWLGSKGWNSTRKTSAKAKPHLPSVLLREHLGPLRTLPRAVRPLDTWLRSTTEVHERSPL